ncbi:hypothetical protein P8452_42619 [Trifolium repens]|nr:hypothetical protein P8452_42619 [Trifolium repens]
MELLAEDCTWNSKHAGVGKRKVDGLGVGVDVASCTNHSNFENEKSDQERPKIRAKGEKINIAAANFQTQDHQ